MGITIGGFLFNQFWGNSYLSYVYAIALLVLTISTLNLIRFLIILRLKKVVDKSQTEFDDLVFKIIARIFTWPVIIVLSLSVSLEVLELGDFWEKYFSTGVLIVLLVYVIKGLFEILDFWWEKIRKQVTKPDKEGESAMLDLSKKIIKLVIWFIAVIVILQNLGVNLSGILTGIGVGSIIIAFAMQNILEDIFASASIHFEQPFIVGDYIDVGEDGGTVKKIGLKTTRIRTLAGDELIISNKELSESRIRNYRKITRRRGKIVLEFDYANDIEKIKQVPEIIKNIVNSFNELEFNSMNLRKLDKSSISYFGIYYTKFRSFKKYLELQHQLNIRILEEMEKADIKFAYPTQQIILKNQ